MGVVRAENSDYSKTRANALLSKKDGKNTEKDNKIHTLLAQGLV